VTEANVLRRVRAANRAGAKAMIHEGYRHARAVVGLARAQGRKHDGLRDFLYAWRWPAGLFAAVILWLALVTVVGAGTLAPRVEAVYAPPAGDGFDADAAGLARRSEAVIIQMS